MLYELYYILLYNVRQTSLTYSYSVKILICMYLFVSIKHSTTPKADTLATKQITDLLHQELICIE